MTTGRIIRKAMVAESYKLPQLGKIKVGQKVKNPKSGKEYPQSLDYFVVGDDSNYKSQFKEAYGDAPKSISIVFPSNNLVDVCNERYECRNGAGRLISDGDGTNFRLWNDKEKKYLSYAPKGPEDRKAMSKWGTWKTVLTLKFIIPKIPGVIGVWVFTTSGNASSIPAIRDTFDKVLMDAGVIAGIPFDLTVSKVKSQKPGDNSTFPVVTLIPNISVNKLEDIRNFMDMGGQMRDISKLLSGQVTPPAKQISEPEPEPEHETDTFHEEIEGQELPDNFMDNDNQEHGETGESQTALFE